MWANEWEVLLVDDEPDVISVSKLLMQDFEVYGLPLVIHTAGSKGEALELLNNRPDRRAPLSTLAVAFIDVVMESDGAGLELCRAIREEMGNKQTQLFIRTGQPGIAPERDVIDRYDINGYFTKAEATEDKLYSLVKSGVRQFYWSFLSLVTVNFLNSFFAAGGSREKLVAAFEQIAEVQRKHNVRQDVPRSKSFIMADDEIFHVDGWDEQTARDLMARLSRRTETSLSAEGDSYALDDDGHLMITVSPRPDRSAMKGLYSTRFVPTSDLVRLVHGSLSGLGTAWKHAG